MTRTASHLLLALSFVVSIILLAPPRAARVASAEASPAPAVGQTYCTMYTVSPASQSFSATGGPAFCIVDTGPGGGNCVWHASPSNSWIIVDTGDQAGDKSIVYTVLL